MRILLIGYGKMGKAIEQIALQRGHEITGTIDLGQAPPFPAADVAIEFSQPEAAVKNILQCFRQNIPVVCGTTGWLNELPVVEQACTKTNGALFHSSNYSLGVNIFFKLNEFLAQLMDRHSEYQVTIDETHHTQKKDAPSGTAITLANGVLRNLKRKKEWSSGEKDGFDNLPIYSSRVDPVPGTHVVKYRSPVDDLEIRHTAHSREGFAVGAVLVAEWLVGKHGIYTMDDFLKF